MKSNPDSGDTLYNYACLESTRNNQEKAMELLTKAIEKNKIYIDWAKTDEKLNNIRDIEEFKELLGEASKD